MVYCNGTNEYAYVYPMIPDVNNGNLSMNTSVTCYCDSWYEDTQNADLIAIIRIITSLFSVLGSASIILSVLLTGKLNTAEVHPLFILSVGDFILSILWMIGGIVWLSPGEGGWVGEDSSPHTGMCYVLAVATTMAEMVTFLLTTVYAQSALLRIREVYLNKGRIVADDKKKKIRHSLTLAAYIISWTLPLIIVLPITERVIGIDATNEGCWCILDFYNLRPDDGSTTAKSKFNIFAMTQATIMGVFFIITTGIIVVYYSFTFYFARQVIKQQREYLQEEGRGSKMIKTILIRLSFFLIIYLICGTPTIAASYTVWDEKQRLHLNETQDLTILIIHAIVAPLQGFLNAIVYGWSRREWRKAVNMQQRLKFSRGGGAAAKYESLDKSSNTRVGGLLLNSSHHTKES